MAKAPEIPKVQADTSNGDPLVVIPNSAASIDNKQCWPTATVEWINNNPHLLRPAFLNDPKLKNDGLKFTLSEMNENRLDKVYYRSQDYRAGRNENDSKISASMQESIHIKPACEIVFDFPNGNSLIKTLAGNGRGRSLAEALHFKTIFGWMPNRRLTIQEKAFIGLQSNDHLPETSVTKEDLLHTVSTHGLANLIGITEEEAEMYIKNKGLDENRYTEISQLLRAWLKFSAAKTFTNKTRNGIFNYIVNNIQGASSGTYTVTDGLDLENHVTDLVSMKPAGSYSIALGNHIEPLLCLINDGTRKPENIFGASVNKWDEQQKFNESHGIPDVSVVNVVTAASKIEALNWEAKLGTFWKIYRTRYRFLDFVNKIKKMTNNKDIFTKSIPTINVVGLINPFLQFEKYGLPYKELIDYSDNFPSFDEIVRGLYTDGLISESVKTKRLNEYQEERKAMADFS